MDFYTSWACPLSAHGHGSVKPISQGPSGFISILFSCPLHPFWSVIIETVKNLWVDGSRFMGWRLKWLGWRWLAWRLKMRTSSGVQTSDRLSGSIYGAWHVSFFDWFLSRIKASLCLPCIFPINTRVFSSHFSIFSWNILSERNCYPCQTDSFILSYRTSTHSLCSLGLSIVDSKNW